MTQYNRSSCRDINHDIIVATAPRFGEGEESGAFVNATVSAELFIVRVQNDVMTVQNLRVRTVITQKMDN